MSTQTGHRLTIVEVPQAVARRLPAGAHATAKKSPTKRTRPTTQSKSVKKRVAGEKNLSSTKAKVKPVARPAKSTAAAQIKSIRRRFTARQPNVEMAIEPVLPIEMDIPFEDAAHFATQSDLAVEKIPAVLEPSFAEVMVADEQFAVENNQTSVYPEGEFPTQENTGTELQVIAEPHPNLAVETTTPSETVQRVLLAEPQSIRRTLAFQWNAFLQVLTKGWSWLQLRLKTQQAKKRLRVCESVSLGEKRFIAVVQVDGEQFLVGGSSSSVSTLAHLEQPREFSEVFRRYGRSGMQA